MGDRPHPLATANGTESLVGSACLLAGIVAAAGTDHQASVAGSVGVDLHLTEPSLLLGTGRTIVDRVLIADIASDGPGDLIDFTKIFGEKGDAAGVLGQ